MFRLFPISIIQIRNSWGGTQALAFRKILLVTPSWKASASEEGIKAERIKFKDIFYETKSNLHDMVGRMQLSFCFKFYK